MSERDELRQEYIRRICGALATYLDEGEPLHVHSVLQPGGLAITFTLAEVDRFHAIIEQHDDRKRGRTA